VVVSTSAIVCSERVVSVCDTVPTDLEIPRGSEKVREYHWNMGKISELVHLIFCIDFHVSLRFSNMKYFK